MRSSRDGKHAVRDRAPIGHGGGPAVIVDTERRREPCAARVVGCPMAGESTLRIFGQR